MTTTTASSAAIGSVPSRAWSRIAACLTKDWLLERSYRFRFLFSVFGISTGLATMYFVGRLVGRHSQLTPYGGSYFAYVLVGNAFFAYAGSALHGVAGRVMAEQSFGALEALLATPLRIWEWLLAMMCWSLSTATLQVILYCAVGSWLFGVDFSRVHWGSAGALLGLAMLAFNGLGLMEAACTLVFRRGALIAWTFNGFWALLGGVFFPVTVLPVWLQRVAEWVPITHAIRGLQLAIYQGAPPSHIWRELCVLAAMAVCVAPLAVWSWRVALRRVKRDGGLVTY